MVLENMDARTSDFLARYPFLREILKVEKYCFVDLASGESPEEVHKQMLEEGWQVSDDDRELLARILDEGDMTRTGLSYVQQSVKIPYTLEETELGISELLNIPRQRVHHSMREDLEEWTKYHFVMKDGTVIKNAVKPETKNTTPGNEETTVGETVLEAIERLGVNPDEIQAVVGELYYRHWRMNLSQDDEYEEDHEIFVYNIPAEQKLSGLMDMLKREYTEKLENVKKLLSMREIVLHNGTKIVLNPVLLNVDSLDELPKYVLPSCISYEINLDRDCRQVNDSNKANYRIHAEYRPYAPDDEQWFFLVKKKAQDDSMGWDGWYSAGRWFSAGSLGEGLEKSLNALEIAEKVVPERDLRDVCREVFGETVRPGNSAKL